MRGDPLALASPIPEEPRGPAVSGAGGLRQPPTACRAAADGRQEAASGAETSTAPQGFVSEQAKAVLPLGLS